MISITCTNCQTVLTIDDAFAGGVCRCQHCGTIQTVPAHLKGSATAPHPGGASATTKTLYQNQKRNAGGQAAAGTSAGGLDDLASAVASSGLGSSGLGGSGLSSHRLTSTPPQQAQGAAPPAQGYGAQAPAAEQSPRRKFPVVPLAVGGGVLLLALIGLIIFLALGRGGPSTGTSGETGGAGGSTFCGLNINAPSVVYLLDRGNSIADAFDPVKAATYQSLASLGPDRRFAVILWNNGGDDVTFPKDGLRNASPEEIENCKHALEDVVATGSSTLRGALEKAMARQPGAIIIVTSKSRLEEDDENALANARDTAAGHTRFFGIVVGEGIDNPTLKLLAPATGGQYRQVTERDLRNGSF